MPPLIALALVDIELELHWYIIDTIVDENASRLLDAAAAFCPQFRATQCWQRSARGLNERTLAGPLTLETSSWQTARTFPGVWFFPMSSVRSRPTEDCRILFQSGQFGLAHLALGVDQAVFPVFLRGVGNALLPLHDLVNVPQRILQ